MHDLKAICLIITYSLGGVAKFAHLRVLDHVVTKKSGGKVVIRSDDAGEARDAGHREKQIFHEFLPVKGHYLNYYYQN